MAENTKIEWADHTFNPVMGCQKVSEGCKHCYAEAANKRFGLAVWGAAAARIRTSQATWKAPRIWDRRAAASGARARVFCASWADVGEDNPDWVDPRRDLVRLIDETPSLDWMLLTKRTDSLARLFKEAGWPGAWPRHVWAGASVENQAAADSRIPHLVEVPAAVRFLSCEPLLGPLDLRRHLAGGGVHWLITGGETGAGARSFDLAWARSLRDQCAEAKVAFFFKQAGSRPVLGGARLSLRDSKGGNLLEIPEDLRIREFPAG